MSNWIRNCWYWKLVTFRFINGTLMVGECALMASVVQSHLFTQHFIALVMFWTPILMAMQKSVEMFLDQTQKDLKDGQPKLGETL